ncbi:MAG: AarF/UbiB family protein [Gemmatimonadota bacterium]|nr:AarF/UbiB family protein [Gemmatimonadota bacterium]
MTISLDRDHLRRYRDVAWLLWKHGRGDVVRQAGLEEVLPEEERQRVDGLEERAEELADDLERLGPTWVKLGQLLSTRADLLPLPYIEALSRLQDRVEPFGYDRVEETVERELGVRISKAFETFDPEPLAAASLGQVHRATLRDGRLVAVKVQRPGIRRQVVVDLEAMEEVAGFLDAHTDWGPHLEFRELVREFRRLVLEEFDYRREAAHLEEIGSALERFEKIVVPRPVVDYTTDRILVMDLVEGRKVTALSPLARLEIDGEPLADALFEAYLEQILVNGRFHADPHPGNVFVTGDGRVALIDLGQVARIGPRIQQRLLRLLIAVSEGRGEDAADVACELGEVRDPDFDSRAYRRRIVELVDRVQSATVGELEVGRVVMEISRIATEHGIRVPQELAMLGKTLLHLDSVGRALAPEYDPNAAVRRYAGTITSERMRKDVSPGSVLTSMMESAEFLQRLPRRVDGILERLAENELRIQVDSVDERTLVEGFQKIANRVTVGLILASLVVGAALLMRVETEFTILGYPGLAIVCFLGAAAGAVWLVIDILLHDRGEPPGRRPGA